MLFPVPGFVCVAVANQMTTVYISNMAAEIYSRLLLPLCAKSAYVTVLRIKRACASTTWQSAKLF